MEESQNLFPYFLHFVFNYNKKQDMPGIPSGNNILSGNNITSNNKSEILHKYYSPYVFF